ncbi:hypothetical protein JDO7802_00837 [Jannaschia donghaensis]|uniref:Uncharacterized protein n=1 Tax=Jannaschia donghaensis TaxID=420998 RepID=A0A0M6YFV7_9RHOB|nr:hypothetical protein JDO7802_00837 [Jannaschia donghaensis]
MPEKLATCCYCGRRSALRMADHTLVCGSCGAPLRNMKPLRPAHAQAIASHPADPRPHKMPRPKPMKRRKKRKSVWKKLADRVEDVWDEIEDIFD